MRYVGMNVLLGLTLLIATGCSGASADVREPAGPTSPLDRMHAATDIDGAVVGAPAPGTRVTVVVVFASWCGPCRDELAMLGEIRRTTSDLRVIGLNAYEQWGKLSDEDRLRGYLAQHAPWLQVVHADAALLGHFGGVPKVPTIFLFDRYGRMVSEFRRANRAPPTRAELELAIADARGCAAGVC
jgi:thiol-disulfide isomerase/thioredoxin